MSTPDAVLQKAEELLKTIQAIAEENTQLKAELKMFIEQHQVVEQQARFTQNMTNQIAHYMNEDREADGQWKMKQFVFQVQVRVEGERVEIGRSQLLKPSVLAKPGGGIILP